MRAAAGGARRRGPRAVMAEPEGMPLLCALDQGTTSTRAIMYEAATLKPVAVHQLEHAQLMPQAGCAARPMCRPLDAACCSA